MLLQCCALGVTMSWDDGFLGARASRPHKAWHSLGHLLHLDRPATAPWFSFGPADAVSADRVAACGSALKLSGGQRDRMRAGRPRSQITPPLRGSRRSRAGRRRLMRWGVSGGRLLRKPSCTLWETPVCPRAVLPPCRADHTRVKQVLFHISHWTGPPRRTRNSALCQHPPNGSSTRLPALSG